jgi:organic radical activating enzyme
LWRRYANDKRKYVLIDPLHLFGGTLNLKERGCKVNGVSSSVDPYVNIYVRLTNKCNANCPFCAFNGPDNSKFDRYKLVYILNHIREHNVRINKISFTGGEPTTSMDDLVFCLKEVKKIDRDIFTVVSSNGYNIDLLGEDRALVDSIALSRHHYDEDLNTELFGGVKQQLPTNVEGVHLTCNLVKGYIDSKEECRKFIEEMGKRGFTDIGFVSLMNVNGYCSDHSVDFSHISLGEMEDTIQTTDISKGISCKCANYLTSLEDGTIVKSYSRYVFNSMACDPTENTLVYDLNHLKVGFNGRTLFK